jgi:hypothetical protein
MSGLKYAFASVRGELEAALAAIEKPIAAAASGAMREAADLGKVKAREAIAAAGFSRKWQNAMRADAFPKRGVDSTSAAAVLRHTIPYASVFAEGATVSGRPNLWVPLSTTPKINAREKLTPKAFVGAFGPLFSMRNAATPVLAARLSVSKSAAKRGAPYKITKVALKRGARREGIVRAVPVFIALRNVTIPRKFDLEPAFASAADALPSLYAKHLKPEDF